MLVRFSDDNPAFRPPIVTVAIIGFFDGWWSVTEQLAALVEKAAAQ